MEEQLKSIAERIRKKLLEIELDIRAMNQNSFFQNEQARPGQHAEVRDNLTLAVRHCEDARMRLGKVCQHADSGQSIYS